jgi:hypothetical protein
MLPISHPIHICINITYILLVMLESFSCVMHPQISCDVGRKSMSPILL